MAQLTQELRVRQTTLLTPRLQQSVKLLQMSTLDFNRELLAAIANNPFLEEPDENETATQGASSTAPEPSAEAVNDSHTPSTEYLPMDIESGNHYSGDYPAPHHVERSDTDVGLWARSTTSLPEALRRDVCGYQLSPREHQLVDYIIDALDDDGYLRTPYAELSNKGQFSPPVTDKEWETALLLVQQLSLPGLAARDLVECLRLQLHALPDTCSAKSLALQILDKGLDKLQRCDYAGLSRLLLSPEDQIHAACKLLRSLNPHPGASYQEVDAASYVIPDAIVSKVGQRWLATSNRDATPAAKLNTLYAELFRETRSTDRALMSQALQEARWLLRSLEQRTNTIQRVAQAIVARQQLFFDYGDIALQPMMLKEIADELELHESTISRATSNKYLATPRGIFEFKHFFSGEMATNTGGHCSTQSIRARIQELISSEDPCAPFSDVVLASKLAQEGIKVARRTVSKYRAQINQPPAEMRRML